MVPGEAKRKGKIMAKSHNNGFLHDLLNLLNNPIHRRQHHSRVRGPNGDRIIEGATDETGIGSHNETENVIVDDIYIFDCGHTSKGNLGGQCHYCDGLICQDCISICSSCGHSLCPQHTVIADFEGQNKPYCRACSSEITRKLKLRSAVKMFGSFFISNNKDKNEKV
jgi:hypothetical protein